MDALLALIVAMLLFVVLVIIINRSIKIIVFLGTAVVAVLVLRALGVLG
jgi:hypothetical protein